MSAGVEKERVAYDKIRKVISLLISTGAAAVLLIGLAVATRATVGDHRAAAALVLAHARPWGQAGDDEVPESVLLQHIDAMLQALPWAVGADAEKQAHPKVTEYERNGLELRADELLLGATGQDPPELASRKDVKFPPARPRT